MQANLTSMFLLLAIIVVYVVAKVRYYMRVSDEQWRRVDKSKLVDWSGGEDSDKP
ncbi:MAG: hypothetical protein V2I25_13205 [Woeseiaceae bacterium]|jgi:hypothetical protein|nr:hypothetical protein [Woeseiaceae bacterium]